MRFSSRLDWSQTPNALAAALDGARARGAEILDLTESNPPRAGLLWRPEEVFPVLSDPRALQYQPEPRGLDSARDAVARAYDCDPSALLLTSSTSEAYSWLFKLLCDPGDEVLVPAPSYPLFDYLASLESVHARRYALRYHEGWWIDLDALEAAITSRTRAVLLVNPNNPTGSYLKRAEFDRLSALCERRGCALISDEVFAEYPLTDDAERIVSLAPQERVLAFSLGGLSKSCGLPQMKLAWIVVSGPPAQRDAAMRRLELIADTFLPVSAPVQLAAPHWLEHRASFQRRLLDRLRTNLSRTDFSLAVESRTDFSLSVESRTDFSLSVEGGWYAVLRLPRTRSEEQWTIGLLEDRGVLVQPGYFFDFETEPFAVVSLLTRPEVFGEGMRRLTNYIDAHG